MLEVTEEDLDEVEGVFEAVDSFFGFLTDLGGLGGLAVIDLIGFGVGKTMGFEVVSGVGLADGFPGFGATKMEYELLSGTVVSYPSSFYNNIQRDLRGSSPSFLSSCLLL